MRYACRKLPFFGRNLTQRDRDGLFRPVMSHTEIDAHSRCEANLFSGKLMIVLDRLAIDRANDVARRDASF
jgi:hypothetical protein